MSKTYFLGIDVSTTGSKALLVDENGAVAATAAAPPGVSVAYTSPAVSNVLVTSTPKSHSIGAPGCVGWW